MLSRVSGTALLILAAAVLPPALYGAGDDQEMNWSRMLSERRESGLRNHRFSSGFGLSYAGPAWLMNALPGYSSGRAREMWYLSLDRGGDRELRLYDSGGADVMTTNPYRAFRTDFATSPFQSSRTAV